MGEWISSHGMEILGVLFSLLYLYFSIRQNIWLWLMGMLSAILYMIVFYRSKFYADMALNAYYLVISVYGWVFWSRGSAQPGTPVPVTRVTRRQAVILGGITLAVFLAIGQILHHLTDSPVPHWDAFTTAVSFTATWMLARKILEHWILWVVVDLVSMGLYAYRGLYPTLFLFAIYTGMAVVGWYRWRKQMKTNHEQN